MLEASIRSVLSQSYDAFELIVVDNASDDATEDLVFKVGDSRIRYFKNPRTIGMYANHNRCVQLASSEWLLFLHSDDTMTENALTELVRYLPLSETISIVSPASRSKARLMNDSAEILKGRSGKCKLLRWPSASPSGTLYRKSWLGEHPFSEEGLAADLRLMFDVLSSGQDILLLRSPVVRYGIGVFQESHRWCASGKFLDDVSMIVVEQLSDRRTLRQVLQEISDWEDKEVCNVLLMLANKGETRVIAEIEGVFPARASFKRMREYRHVRNSRIFGRNIYPHIYATYRLFVDTIRKYR